MAKILLINRDTGISMDYKVMLEAVGHEATVAADPKEALDQLRKGQYDMFVTGYGKPDQAFMTGVEMIAELRKIEKADGRPHIPAIVASGSGDGMEITQKLRTLEGDNSLYHASSKVGAKTLLKHIAEHLTPDAGHGGP